jgi:hypothetical protein
MKTTISLIILAVLFAAFPATYFFLHLGDKNFIDASMANLFATIVGLVIGIPIGLAISRAQQSRETKALAARTAEQANQRLSYFLLHTRVEIRTNADNLLVLDKILSITNHGRADTWDVAKSVASSFSFEMFTQLQRDASFLPYINLADGLFKFYFELRQLSDGIRMAASLHSFYFSFGGGEKKANELFSSVQTETKAMFDRAKKANESLESLIKTIVKDAT